MFSVSPVKSYGYADDLVPLDLTTRKESDDLIPQDLTSTSSTRKEPDVDAELIRTINACVMRDIMNEKCRMLQDQESEASSPTISYHAVERKTKKCPCQKFCKCMRRLKMKKCSRNLFKENIIYISDSDDDDFSDITLLNKRFKFQ
jgi:hypothetical protein